ncbi:MAG TPA: hypothetical protein VF190_00020, partial [Rhodothermales bacterium]
MLVLALVVIATAAAPSALAQTATVRGFITDAANREPLEGVNIVMDDSAGTLRGAVTDRNGFYLI